MKKAAIQFIVLVFLFFATWMVLRQVDWMTVLNVKQATQTSEEKLGKIIWEVLSRTNREVHSATVNNAIDSLVGHLCRYNSIDKNKLKVKILYKNEVNAFALPDDYLVVYSGLLEAAENEAEITGVLGHEIAHLEKNHVMKKLVKEVGLSVIISMTSGSDNGQVAREIVKVLTSTAYDRELEREADITSVDYMINADIDPEPFANFLYRLADETKHIPSQVYWVATHPDSKERAEDIIEYIKGKNIKKKKVLSPETWDALKKKLKDLDS